MGQSTSTHGSPSGSTHRHHHHHHAVAKAEVLALLQSETFAGDEVYIDELPDECLANVFQTLNSGDRRNCSLVCRRWFRVEGQTRQRLSLNAHSDLVPFLPTLFTRFDSVTKLGLRCDRRTPSVDDDALILISLKCPNLTRLKLRGCREITAVGLAGFAMHARCLTKFSCGSCMFGAKGMSALLENSSTLEELTVKRLRAINDSAIAESISPGLASTSLKSIVLKELYNGQSFAPLIIGSKNLKTLKLLRCLGDWDTLLESISERKSQIVEIHLERLQVSDTGLSAISKCSDLEILHLVKTPECTNMGIITIAQSCKFLRKLHIDGWRTNRIGNEGLIAVGKHCVNLQELVLIGVNPSSISLESLATNCVKLERLALCGSETIGDAEISCIANKCLALKKLCIKGCPISDVGIEAFAYGCPNLVKIKVKKCRGVTGEVADWLRVRRGSLAVNLDVIEIESEVEASASDGAQEEGVESRQMSSLESRVAPGTAAAAAAAEAASSRASIGRSRLGLFGGRILVACPFRRWSNSNGSSPSGNL